MIWYLSKWTYLDMIFGQGYFLHLTKTGFTPPGIEDFRNAARAKKSQP